MSRDTALSLPSAWAQGHVEMPPQLRAPPSCNRNLTAVLAQHKRFLQQTILPHFPRVELCGAADYDACLRVWVESFTAGPPGAEGPGGNPMFRWIVADGAISAQEEDRRFRAQLRYMLHFVNRVYKDRGALLAVRDAGGAIVAAASVLPPGLSADAFTAANFAAVGMPPTMRHRLSWGAAPCKKLNSLSAVDDAKKALRKEAGPCWYLLCLGVMPGCQGQGHGRDLLRAVCAAADAQGLPAHLECETEWHQRLYGRYGFETVRRVDLSVKEDPVSVPQFLMLRQPK